MSQRTFGGRHTAAKLDVLETYLERFITVLKNQKFQTIYFDAFAGTGEIRPAKDNAMASLFDGEDLDTIIRGSAQRALELRDPFGRYIFVENSSKKASALTLLREGYPSRADRIEVVRGDANTTLQDFCLQTNWQTTRAVIFLDPFGNQVTWDTIVQISKTKADLWYLFPAGLGVSRQISRDGSVFGAHAKSIDALFGRRDWLKAFTTVSEVPDMFARLEPQSTKTADATAITRYAIELLKEPFGGRVLDDWLPLGSGGVHMYSLLFAWANPDHKARLAATLATAVLGSKKRSGRT